MTTFFGDFVFAVRFRTTGGEGVTLERSPTGPIRHPFSGRADGQYVTAILKFHPAEGFRPRFFIDNRHTKKRPSRRPLFIVFRCFVYSLSGNAYVRFFPSPFLQNSTVPSTRAKSVWSCPCLRFQKTGVVHRAALANDDVARLCELTAEYSLMPSRLLSDSRPFFANYLHLSCAPC